MEIVVFWIIMAVVVAIIAGNKGRSGVGWFVYGLAVWPIALVHVLVVPRTADSARARDKAEGRRPCPHCAEMILPAAQVCPFYRSEIAPAPTLPPRPANPVEFDEHGRPKS